jgi:LRR receptor-like serine/threonine-protein kinase FLS2
MLYLFIQQLILSDNPHLGGRIPDNLPNLCAKLMVIQLHNSALSGPVPNMLISQLPHLQKLLLHDNVLTGASPLTLIEGEVLESSLKPSFDTMGLGMGRSSMSGGAGGVNTRGKGGKGGKGDDNDKDSKSSMAASLVHRPLTRISLHGNNFKGSLGVLSACNKLKLEDLSLGRNQFTGSIDCLLERWSESTDQRVNISSLSLDRNLLSGKFPVNLNCIRFSLKSLNLSHNKLTGALDGRVLGDLMVLERLILSHNEFRGLIPESLSSLSTSLQQLVCGHNQLSGPLPCGALAHLHKLRSLDLQHNHLSGPCTDFFTNMSDLRELNLGFNGN